MASFVDMHLFIWILDVHSDMTLSNRCAAFTVVDTYVHVQVYFSIKTNVSPVENVYVNFIVRARMTKR